MTTGDNWQLLPYQNSFKNGFKKIINRNRDKYKQIHVTYTG